MDAPEPQIRSAVESILENARLTADLNDEAAQVLLDWGVELARQIAIETTTPDGSTLAEVRETRLKATRRMMRQINNWVSRRDEKDHRTHLETLGRIAGAVDEARGGSVLPDKAARRHFIENHVEDPPPDFIVGLRILFEE